jgi:hypothetical protein
MGKKCVCLVFASFLVLGPALAANATVDPVGWWKFDDQTGTTAVDSSVNKNNGTLNGGVTWITGQLGGAVQCDGNNGYVSLPIGSVISKLTSSTFAIWANYSRAGGAWQRIFDFGTGQTVNMFLTPAQGASNTGNMRFAITTGGAGAESQLNAPSRLATGWHHIAVVFDGSTRAMQLYLDGAVVASGTTTTLPNALGNTTQNWLGQSQYPDAHYQGALDDLRIYDRVLGQAEIRKVMQGIAYGMASSPYPQNNTKDVHRDAALGWMPGEVAKTHDVYLGTSLAEIMSASRTNPGTVLVSKGQDANSYVPPAVLEFGKTYYWRVDEVNAVPTTIYTGMIWSFTVEPVSIPITGVTATASSAYTAKGMTADKSCNGSGIDPNTDAHSITAADMWTTNKGTTLPAWIQYTFDRPYKLDKLLVWNSNQQMESDVGYGAKDVTIEYSPDGTTWTGLGDFVFAQASGEPNYVANTTVDFAGIRAQAVKLTINSNYSDFVQQVGLSEVRFYAIPVFAREPVPAADANFVDPRAPLSWRAGREAVSHQVYVGTDPNAVQAGTVPFGTATSAEYEAPIALDQTYYWKVVEVNNATTPSTWAGDVWSFTTNSYIVVDDFESYTDQEGEAVFQIWIDGYESQGKNGAWVGLQGDPVNGTYCDRVIRHGGSQSMPVTYTNTGGIASEAVYTFLEAQDWSQYGITTLVVWFRGDMNNVPAPLYVKINNTKVQFNNGASATAFPLWKQWNIDLTGLGATLKSVQSLTIGIGDGMSISNGSMWFDDIRLYATAPPIAVPADPGTNGLVALYAMEGDAKDTSGKGNNGTVSGGPSFVNGMAGYGKALSFDGLDDYVTLPIGTMLSTMSSITVGAWINWTGTTGYQRVFDFGNDQTTNFWMTPNRGGTSSGRVAITIGGNGAESGLNGTGYIGTGWHHVAVTIDGATKAMVFYIDGTAVRSGTTALLPKDMGVTTNDWLGRSQYTADSFYSGLMDDFRIFNRALSASEIRYLAGDR